MLTYGELFCFFLSFILIVTASVLLVILVKYYDSIIFTQRNTVTYLSLYLICICFTDVVTRVFL